MTTSNEINVPGVGRVIVVYERYPTLRFDSFGRPRCFVHGDPYATKSFSGAQVVGLTCSAPGCRRVLMLVSFGDGRTRDALWLWRWSADGETSDVFGVDIGDGLIAHLNDNAIWQLQRSARC